MLSSNSVSADRRVFPRLTNDVEFVHSWTNVFILDSKSQHLVTAVRLGNAGSGICADGVKISSFCFSRFAIPDCVLQLCLLSSVVCRICSIGWKRISASRVKNGDSLYSGGNFSQFQLSYLLF